MKVGIPRERFPGERRVAATPDTVTRLQKMGFTVLVEAGAGAEASFPDAAYAAAGATLVDEASALWSQADLITKIRPPLPEEVQHLSAGQVLVSLIMPAQNKELVQQIAARGATVIALDQIPRISRAQKMDVLSSMANIAGYRAVIEAANSFGSFFGGLITAAGKTRPARVLVIGAGVAGLAAIAAAKGLGAEVRAFDVRPACKEQCESLGASFLLLDFPMAEGAETKGGYASTMSDEFIAAEMKLFAEQAKEVDIIITTALIPGKRAPILITAEMVDSMRPGSVVVDLAAEQGGNCDYTVPGEAVVKSGVTILGFTDLTSRLATTASQLFGTNISHLLSDMGGATNFRVDHEDEAVRGALVLEKGALMWPAPEPVRPVAPPAAKVEAPKAALVEAPKAAPAKSAGKAGHGGHGGGQEMGATARNVATLIAAALLAAIGLNAPTDFIQHLTVFLLACFVGWQVVWSVTPALHTPLMSVTNAISGIIIVGGMIQSGTKEVNVAAILGAIAILVASINIAGGFLVTHRMLQMFRKEGE